jgi:hypothetical protein
VAAREAADGVRQAGERAEAGAARMADLFSGILSGSMSARDAVMQLLAQIARVQMMQGLTGLAATGAGGGIFGALGGLLGFSGGGWTGNGPEHRIAGVVHGREGVLNARAMRMPGARQMMEAMNAGRAPQAAPAQAPPKPPPPSRVIVTLDNAMLDARVTEGAGEVVRAAGPASVGEAVKRVDRQMRRTKNYGGLR